MIPHDFAAIQRRLTWQMQRTCESVTFLAYSRKAPLPQAADLRRLGLIMHGAYSVPPEVIRAGRVVLRRVRPSDAEGIFEEYAGDADVTRYLTWRPHNSVSSVAEFIAVLCDKWESGRAYAWVITIDGDRACGMISARVHAHMVEIGYALAKRHWGNGYMSEAISGVAEWALTQPSLYRIWASCDIENVASARALEKAGFRREGVLHRWIVHPNISSEPRDSFVYARVK
jgi:[ribosomal protein S5]-alanine N-acetyltransferase